MRRSAAWGAVAALVCTACGLEPPSVGRLEPLYAPPAEDARVYTLRSGQTLDGLLYRELSANDQAALLLAFREHADPRRLRPGTEITFRFLAHAEELRGVDFALHPDSTLRLSREPLGWASDMIRTPIYVDTLYATGEITTSLWNAMVGSPALGELPAADRGRLIDHLDNVFQWQVDFSRQIREGDTYRFAFEREVRPDGSMRAGRILAAELVNGGTPYHAIWFDPSGDGRGSYFDEEGQSVRRAFLMKPLAYRRISSRFTNARFHPILKTWRSHRGVDYAADAGTEIMATADGVVIHRGFDSSYGNSVQIRHPNGFVTRYAHMRGFRSGIAVGSRIHQGDVIGYVGMTGLATGPHLHYEMIRGGQQIDPLAVDLPAGDPVPSEDRSRWREEMTVRMALLESIPGAGPVREIMAQASTELGDDPAIREGATGAGVQ